jgi:hypothetical protein
MASQPVRFPMSPVSLVQHFLSNIPLPSQLESAAESATATGLAKEMLAVTFADRYDDRGTERRWSPIRPQIPDEGFRRINRM